MTDQAPNDDLGAYPELRELPVDQLQIDESYQRDINSARSRRLITTIAETFHWPKFGVVIATPWPEKSTEGTPVWAVIDGQHRTEAARLRGIERVPAVVYDGLSVSEAAAVFAGVNRDRVTVHPMGLHHAMLAAGDTDAIELDRVCRESGVEITRYPVQAKDMVPGQTMAVVSIRKALAVHGADIVTEALSILSAAYAEEAGRIRAVLIKAVAEWVAWSKRAPERADAYDKEPVISWLQSRDQDGIAEEIELERAASGDPAPLCLVRILSRAAGQVTPGASEAVDRAIVRSSSEPQITFEDARPDELQVPVNRQCTGCGTYFKTREIHKRRCDSCAPQTSETSES